LILFLVCIAFLAQLSTIFQVPVDVFNTRLFFEHLADPIFVLIAHMSVVENEADVLISPASLNGLISFFSARPERSPPANGIRALLSGLVPRLRDAYGVSASIAGAARVPYFKCRVESPGIRCPTRHRFSAFFSFPPVFFFG